MKLPRWLRRRQTHEQQLDAVFKFDVQGLERLRDALDRFGASAVEAVENAEGFRTAGVTVEGVMANLRIAAVDISRDISIGVLRTSTGTVRFQDVMQTHRKAMLHSIRPDAHQGNCFPAARVQLLNNGRLVEYDRKFAGVYGATLYTGPTDWLDRFLEVDGPNPDWALIAQNEPTKQWSLREIAEAFRVPPHMVGLTDEN